jgi:hypothetical protein
MLTVADTSTDKARKVTVPSGTTQPIPMKSGGKIVIIVKKRKFIFSA